MSRSTIRAFLLSGLAAGTLCALPAHADVLFSDDFDSDAAASALNFNSFINWTVQGHPVETVDYIRSGGFGISCFGGSGGCVDLDGSTANPGVLVSNTIFSFLPGVEYTLSVQLSGNQRGGASDGFEIGVLGIGSFAMSGLSPSEPFMLQTVTFGVGSPTTGQIFIRDTNPGGDNVGPILDNVLLVDNANGGGKVPEPGTLALIGLGFAALFAASRRRASRH